MTMCKECNQELPEWPRIFRSSYLEISVDKEGDISMKDRMKDRMADTGIVIVYGKEHEALREAIKLSDELRE